MNMVQLLGVMCEHLGCTVMVHVIGLSLLMLQYLYTAVIAAVFNL